MEKKYWELTSLIFWKKYGKISWKLRTLGDSDVSTVECSMLHILFIYNWPSLYAVFFISNFAYIRLRNGLFSGTYPLIYGNPWSFYMWILLYASLFWSPYLSHIRNEVHLYSQLVRALWFITVNINFAKSVNSKNPRVALIFNLKG
jgi:hypothetical protein